MPDKRTFALSPLISCLDMLHLGDELNSMPGGEPVELTFPISDGDVAPFMSGMDVVRQISQKDSLSCHALMFALHPERHIEACAAAGYRAMTVSIEAATHHHRILARIREMGMQAGLAVNPATSLVVLEYLLDRADRVCLLGVEPGSARDACASPALIERVEMLLENIRYRELRTQIMLYGGLNIAIAAKAVAAGANIVALDSQLLQETGEASMGAAMEKCADMLYAVMTAA